MVILKITIKSHILMNNISRSNHFSQVQALFMQENSDHVALVADKVWGRVNNTPPADFIYQNMTIETNEGS